MLFFLLHHIIHKLPGTFSDQTRNLITFLVGIVLYTLLWTYVNTSKSKNLLVASIKYGFYYIFISDCFAMGIVYKNYYNRSIKTEISSAWGSNVPVANTKVDTEDFTNTPVTANVATVKPVVEETTEQIIAETPPEILQEISTELTEEADNIEEFVDDIDNEEEDEEDEEDDEDIDEVDDVEDIEKTVV